MAKQFEFKFSVSQEIIESDKTTKGAIEKIILKNIFQIAGTHQKDMGNYLECKDCISQIDNLKDGAVLLLTENDLKYVK